MNGARLQRYPDVRDGSKANIFSEKMLEDIVFAPTKKMINHIKSKGVLFELHSCGNTTRFLPYTIDLGADLLQLQRRAVDLPAMKKKYGDTIGFCALMEGIAPEVDYTENEVISAVRNTVYTYAPGGGCYTSAFFREPEKTWLALSELYAYSREFYDIEQGRE